MEPKKTFMKTLSIAFALVVVLGGGIWYAKADVEERIVLVEQARAEIRNKEQSISILSVLQGDSEKARQFLPQIEQKLTSKDQLLGFSSDIAFLARQVGFSGAPKFREDTAPQVGVFQKTNFSLALEGINDFDAVGSFFRSVERSNYFVHFTSIDVARDGALLRIQAEGYVVSF